MNDRMFSHRQTQANVSHVRDVLGYRVAGPAVGPLAVGEGEGPGRMLEPDEIIQEIGRALASSDAASKPWRGRSVLVTAGPTHEPIDPVRYVGNRSSGRMGYALAQAAWRRGAEVTVVAGPGGAPAPYGPEVVNVSTAVEMSEAVQARIGDAEPDRDFPRYCRLIAAGKLDVESLIPDLYVLEDIGTAIDDLENGNAVRPMIDLTSM